MESLSLPTDLPARARASAAVLVAANLLPLAGVLLFGWSLLETVLAYWAESIVIGGYTVLRIASAGKGGFDRVLLVPFFIVHYGMFQTVQIGLMLGFLHLDPREALVAPGLQAAVVSFVVSHGWSFWTHWVRGGEREQATSNAEMFRPYPRVFVQQFTVIGGAWIVLTTGDARGFLVLLIALKIGVDLYAHLRSHGRPPEIVPA